MSDSTPWNKMDESENSKFSPPNAADENMLKPDFSCRQASYAQLISQTQSRSNVFYQATGRTCDFDITVHATLYFDQCEQQVCGCLNVPGPPPACCTPQRESQRRRPRSHGTGRGPGGIFSTQRRELCCRHDTAARSPTDSGVFPTAGRHLVKNNKWWANRQWLRQSGWKGR